MTLRFRAAIIMLILAAVCAVASAANFAWDWHDQDVIGRDDPSVANAVKLNESERSALIDAIAARLQKPMSDQGYADDRIREVASLSRIRFVDLSGQGKPVILATSVSLEGGCDANNCPFWIFQNSPDGYVSLLDTVAASYTIQPTSSNGFSDLVIMRHVTASESRLTLYRYEDGKFVDSGCYTATWAPAKDGEIQDPEITACKGGESEPAGQSSRPDEVKSPDQPNAAEQPKPPDEPK